MLIIINQSDLESLVCYKYVLVNRNVTCYVIKSNIFDMISFLMENCPCLYNNTICLIQKKYNHGLSSHVANIQTQRYAMQCVCTM